MVRSLKEAGALPPHFSSARLLMELAFGWAEVWCQQKFTWCVSSWHGRIFPLTRDSEVRDYADSLSRHFLPEPTGKPQDTPEGLRRLGSMVRGRLAELMGGVSEEDRIT